MTEIHEAYGNLLNKKKPLNAVMDEVADVFAWILSAWAICFPNASLDTAFVNYYDNGCPVCASAPCKCGLSDSRPATLPDFGKVALVKENLEKLALEFPGHQKEFSSLLESYQKVLETQNIPLVVAVLSDTRLILEQLRKVVPTLGVEVEVVSMLSSTLRTVDAMLKAEGVRNPSEKSYDVFLSYSTANKDQARAVYDFLISKNVRVFMSEKEIHPSSNWKEAIKDALRSIKLLCIIASPESLDSEWVKTEVDAAWALDIPILPVLYQCAAKNLPDIIREYQFIDYHEYQKIIGVLENSS